ncbi:unnamed protein product [Victoria cruziana]
MAAPSPALSRLSPSLLRPSEISILPASDSRNLCIRASSTNEPDDGIPLAETDSDHRESTIDDQCSSSTPSTAGPERSLFPYRLENGMDVGIYKRPFEDPPRCGVQWHRACIYPESLGRVAMEHVKPGSNLYVEGNLETKVNDKITGVPRQIREIAIRRDETHAKYTNCFPACHLISTK